VKLFRFFGHTGFWTTYKYQLSNKAHASREHRALFLYLCQLKCPVSYDQESRNA